MTFHFPTDHGIEQNSMVPGNHERQRIRYRHSNLLILLPACLTVIMFFQLDMEEMVENQVRTMFLLEQKTQGSRPLTVVSSPSPNSAPPSKTSSPAAASSQSPAAPEIKQQSPFNRTDNRRFSLFRRKKTQVISSLSSFSSRPLPTFLHFYSKIYLLHCYFVYQCNIYESRELPASSIPDGVCFSLYAGLPVVIYCCQRQRNIEFYQLFLWRMVL